MTVSGGATVNAEDNFWGDASGPYHALQNPSGSGNLVNGNGTDLDFQPFLLAPIGYINERPVASLLLDRKIATIGETVTLDGSASNDDGHIYKYLFDFGDGYQSGWTTSSTAKHSYSHVGIYNVSLVVMDEYTVKSGTAAMEAINIVRQLPSLVVSLKAEPNTVQSGENSTITIYVSDGKSPVDDATILLASDKNGIFSPEWGHTDPNGQFTCTFVAPLVTARTECEIAVNVTKAGYLDSQAQVTVTVVEDGGADLWVFIVGVAGVIVVIFVWAARRKSGKAE
jgi:PKD repeat protein